MPLPVVGLLLGAGAGRRMGRPKALVADWLVATVEVLRGGGCRQVVVVLGAAAEQARALLAEDDPGKDERLGGVHVVVAEDWAEGMGASLRAGLDSLVAETSLVCEPQAVAALVMLVDTPDVSSEVVRRLLRAPIESSVLARAVYAGRPGHPVLLGRDHWAGVTAAATGDHGARDYLAGRDVELVECGDLATGRDVDVGARGRPTPDQPEGE